MNKKVVFITGCSTGIGRALCEEFHQCGFRVIAIATDELAKKLVGKYNIMMKNINYQGELQTRNVLMDKPSDQENSRSGFWKKPLKSVLIMGTGSETTVLDSNGSILPARELFLKRQ